MAVTEREVRERFAANIDRLRRGQEMSVEGLARRSRVDEREIRQILRGDEEARYGTIAMIAGALGVEPGELFRGITWIPPTEGRPGRYTIDNPDGG